MLFFSPVLATEQWSKLQGTLEMTFLLAHCVLTLVSRAQASIKAFFFANIGAL